MSDIEPVRHDPKKRPGVRTEPDAKGSGCPVEGNSSVARSGRLQEGLAADQADKTQREWLEWHIRRVQMRVADLTK